jgi:hypothetical protein
MAGGKWILACVVKKDSRLDPAVETGYVAAQRDVHIDSRLKTDRTLDAHFVHVGRGRRRLLLDGVISILFFGFLQSLKVEVGPSRIRTKVVVVALVPVNVFAE